MSIKVNDKHVHAIGRRKRSTARVFLQPGKGEVIINRKVLSEHFSDAQRAMKSMMKPLSVLALDGQFDIIATCQGGGVTGQAEALRLAIARALVLFEQKTSAGSASEEESEEGVATKLPWHTVLRNEGYLTRDSRVVLRKLVGRRKARKKEQYSKR